MGSMCSVSPPLKTETFEASFFISTARDVTLQQEAISQIA